MPLSSVSESDFDTIFYPGGHGPMWDLPDNKESIKLIESFYNHGKPVALVCHAPVALKNVKTPDGEFLIKGKEVAAFTNTEEEAVQLTEVVPFLLEDMLKERGANFQKGGLAAFCNTRWIVDHRTKPGLLCFGCYYLT